MAAHGKKRRTGENGSETNGGTPENDVEDDSESMEEEEEDSESETEEMEYEEIDVDFEGRPIEPPDAPPIKHILGQLLLDGEVAHGLTDIILEQSTIGSVIKQSEIPEESDDEDSDGVFGLISAVNITEKKALPSVQSFRNMLLSKCKEASDKKSHDILSKMLDDADNHVGLVICERFINIPSKIACPMYESLRNDIATAISKNMKYKFSYYVMLNKLYKPVSGLQNSNSTNDMYVNQEDSEFKKEALINFKFSVEDKVSNAFADKWNGSEENELTPLRQVLVLSAEKWNTVVDGMKTLFDV